MARSISWAVLLCFTLLLLSISHGNGRRILVSEADREKGRFLQELFKKETEGMVLLDYAETGPNVNGQSGWTTPLPPPPTPPLPRHPLPPPPPHQKH